MSGTRDWNELLERIDFAFQPIVNIHTGTCYAFEALARGVEDAGFSSVDAMFRVTSHVEEIYRIDALLRENALRKFAKAQLADRFHVFLNIDSRSLDQGEELAHVLQSQVRRFGIPEHAIACEIAERQPSGFSGATFQGRSLSVSEFLDSAGSSAVRDDRSPWDVHLSAEWSGRLFFVSGGLSDPAPF